MQARIYLLLIALFSAAILKAQVEYPAPVSYIELTTENKNVKVAFMDIAASKPNGKSVLLLHGKNFAGYYWKELIPFLTDIGYRVVIPDEPGFGLSAKPDLHYSFHELAALTGAILDSLHIQKITLLGHSMGGMLALRFALLFPDRVDKMILEDPIGLEDYKTFVPYRSIREVYEQERKATYESYKKYQQQYYPDWKPEYELYVKAQAAALQDPDFDKIAWINALTYDMIYQQPVVYEFANITVPVLLIVGEKDRTIVGKDLLSDSAKSKHGNYPELAKAAGQWIRHINVIELKGIGHIPHVQDLPLFEKSIFDFLRR